MLLGASGFIGRWVARALARQGAALILPMRRAGPDDGILARRGIHGERIELDLTDTPRLAELIRQREPAIVFNLAGYGVDRSERDEALSHRINAQLVEVLCDALRRPASGWGGIRLVHAGSALEYGAIGGNLDEAAAPNPTTVYGRTKLAGTQAVVRAHATGLKAVTARLFTVYGAGEHPGRLLPMLLAARGAHDPIPLTAGLQRRDFTYVEDAAEGLLRLGILEAVPHPILNLATGRLHSVREFTEIAAGVLGIARARLSFGALPTRPEEMSHDPVTTDRLRGTTGWVPPTPPSEGIGAAVRAVASMGD